MTALIFDAETHKLHGDLIEAAFIGVDFLPQSGLIINQTEFKRRYKPSEPIGLGAMAVHHIIDEDLEKCPSYTEFRFPDNLKVQYLIGHNIDYDIATIARSGVDTSNIKAICTLAMSRYLWPTIESHNLSALAYHVSENRKKTRYDIKNAHSALVDCNTTFALLKAIVKAEGITSIEQLYAFSEIARIPTHIFYTRHKGTAIRDLSERDLMWLYEKSEDHYLNKALELEIKRRRPHEDDPDLPF